MAGQLRVPRGAMSVAAARQRREGLLNCAMFFRPAYEAHRAFNIPRVRAMLEVWDMLGGRAVPDRVLSRIAYAAGAPHALAWAAWRKLRSRSDAAVQWRMRALFECAAC